ncbi:hypothetical protein JW935_29235 [candidate division KSB1 bacterium]|nr:hypothetical protein [candidate division KSB1 bacterium]
MQIDCENKPAGVKQNAAYTLYAETGLAQDIGQLQRLFKQKWYSSKTGPFALKPITLAAKRERESHLSELLQGLAGLKKYSLKTVTDRNSVRKKILRAFKQYLLQGLSFSEEQTGYLYQSGMVKHAARFALAAGEFDSGLKRQHIYQASRNVWSMYGLQSLLGKPVKLTPSIMAYSLLYPYTDNYLDDPEVSAEEKSRFNADFAKRLAGKNVAAKNDYEEIIYKLVSMIESEWDRPRYPRVYQSLLAINWAQQASLKLLKNPTPGEISDIVFLKGGTSVLADGFLVAGDLTPDQMKFFYGYGVLLQLLDDVQDIGQDRAAGLKTLFSSNGNLELNINKSLHFAPEVMAYLSCFLSAPPPLLSLIKSSALYLFVNAVGRSRQYIDRHYVSETETCSPVRFGTFESMQEKYDFKNIPLFDILKIFAFPGR